MTPDHLVLSLPRPQLNMIVQVTGGLRCGKTHLMDIIVKALRAEGYNVQYLSRKDLTTEHINVDIGNGGKNEAQDE